MRAPGNAQENKVEQRVVESGLSFRDRKRETASLSHAAPQIGIILFFNVFDSWRFGVLAVHVFHASFGDLGGVEAGLTAIFGITYTCGALDLELS